MKCQTFQKRALVRRLASKRLRPFYEKKGQNFTDLNLGDINGLKKTGGKPVGLIQRQDEKNGVGQCLPRSDIEARH
jgi:hypothetical protein